MMNVTSRIIVLAVTMCLLSSGLMIAPVWKEARSGINGMDAGSSVRTPDSDNSFAAATGLVNNSFAQGSVNTTDDPLDLFKISLSANSAKGDLTTVNLTVNQSNGIAYIAIINPEYYTIVSDLVAYGYVNYFNHTFCAASPGNFYVFIYCYLAELRYNISVYYRSVSRTTDNDNTNATATTAVSGGSYPGNLNLTYDYIDLYNISVTSGTTLTEGVTVQCAYWQNKELVIYNPDGTLRDGTNLVWSSDPNDMEEMKFAADQTGNYRIVVHMDNMDDTPAQETTYVLNTTITPNVPPDNDYDEDHALLVYNSTKVNSTFDSEFDQDDYYMIDLSTGDNLTVSLRYTDNIDGGVGIDIYSPMTGGISHNSYGYYKKGEYTYGIAETNGRYYIDCSKFHPDTLNYTVLFSLNGENLLFPKNSAPVINVTNVASCQEDSLYAKMYMAQDPDLDTLAWSLRTNATFLGISPTTGLLSGTPHNSDVGPHWVNVSVDDGNGGKDWSNFTLTVVNVNDPPTIDTTDWVGINQGVLYSNDYNATDIDPTHDTLAWSLGTDATFLSIAASTGVLSGLPTNNDVGQHWVNVSVSDGHGGMDWSNFTLNVQNVNDPPEVNLTYPAFSFDEDTVDMHLDVKKWFKDIDGDALTYSFQGNKNISVAILQNGTVVLTPAANWSGVETVTFKAFDGQYQVSQSINITVLAVQDLPEGAAITLEKRDYFAGEAQPAFGNASDPDLAYGDSLTFTWYSNVSGKIGTGQNVNLSLAAGSHTITLNVTDKAGNWCIATKDITIKKRSTGTDDDIDDDITPANDTDKDGMDDSWEMSHFGNLDVKPGDDPDKDGLTNLQEYQQGKDPNKADNPVPDDDTDDDVTDDDTSSNLGLIIAGIVAGVVILLVIVGIIVFLMMRKKKPQEQTAVQQAPGTPTGPTPEGQTQVQPAPSLEQQPGAQTPVQSPDMPLQPTAQSAAPPVDQAMAPAQDLSAHPGMQAEAQAQPGGDSTQAQQTGMQPVVCMTCGQATQPYNGANWCVNCQK